MKHTIMLYVLSFLHAEVALTVEIIPRERQGPIYPQQPSIAFNVKAT